MSWQYPQFRLRLNWYSYKLSNSKKKKKERECKKHNCLKVATHCSMRNLLLKTAMISRLLSNLEPKVYEPSETPWNTSCCISVDHEQFLSCVVNITLDLKFCCSEKWGKQNKGRATWYIRKKKHKKWYGRNQLEWWSTQFNCQRLSHKCLFFRLQLKICGIPTKQLGK